MIDGNHREVVRDGPVWRRADTVVRLEMPKSLVMRQMVKRIVGRVLRRDEL